METPPQNATVLDGKDATLSCRAAGSPAPNTTWIFMGKYRSRLPRPRCGVPLGVPHPPEEGPRGSAALPQRFLPQLGVEC